MNKILLAEKDHDNLVMFCGFIADDPKRMYTGLVLLLESLNRQDQETLLIRLMPSIYKK